MNKLEQKVLEEKILKLTALQVIMLGAEGLKEYFDKCLKEFKNKSL